MFDGQYGTRFETDDPSQLGNPLRDRMITEIRAIMNLAELEASFRKFLLSLPGDMDGRCRAAALTKLDELVMWAKKGIDA